MNFPTNDIVTSHISARAWAPTYVVPPSPREKWPPIYMKSAPELLHPHTFPNWSMNASNSTGCCSWWKVGHYFSAVMPPSWSCVASPFLGKIVPIFLPRRRNKAGGWPLEQGWTSVDRYEWVLWMGWSHFLVGLLSAGQDFRMIVLNRLMSVNGMSVK